MEFLQCQESSSEHGIRQRMILILVLLRKRSSKYLRLPLFSRTGNRAAKKQAYRKSEKALHFAYFKSEQRRISQYT